VVQPGARAAARASRSGRITVISTESTARHGAYEREILRLRPEARVVTRPCPLFVALAEEGWTAGEIVAAVAREYLEPLFGDGDGGCGDGPRSDCLLLGCTHFPPFTDTFAAVAGPDVAIVDSAATTAAAVREEVTARGLAARGLAATGSAADDGSPDGGAFVRMFATDAPERFVRVARHFLPEELMPERVELVDL
jgi:glutamate racemase